MPQPVSPAAPAPAVAATAVAATAVAATARGLRTRERLLDAAEHLWGARGVDAVSLREIRIAAGQRNSSALQFHFGDRDGLLLALSQRHMPRVAALQEEIYVGIVASGREDDLAALVEVMVRPNAEYLRRGLSERAWIRISAEQIGRPELAMRDVLDHTPAIARLVGGKVYSRVTDIVGPALAFERLMAVLVAAHHLCADRARLEDAPRFALHRKLLPFDDWLANLLAMSTAAMTAPTAPLRGNGENELASR